MDYAQAREAASRAAAAHTASAFQSSLHSALRQPSPYETPRYETPRYDATPRAYGGPAGAYDVNRSDLNVRSAYEDRRATTPYEEPRAAEPRPRPYDYRTSAPPPGPRYASATPPPRSTTLPTHPPVPPPQQGYDRDRDRYALAAAAAARARPPDDAPLVWVAACSPVCYFVDYWRSMVHVGLAAGVLRGGYVARRARLLRERCAEIFYRIDVDRSGSLDVDEISAAVTAFAASMNVKPPSADEVARAFAAVDDGDGILTLVEFQDFIFRFPDLAKALGVDAKRDDDLVVGEDGAAESSDDDGDGASRQDTEVERVARTLAKWHPSLGALSTSHKKAIKAALPPAKSVRRSSLAPPRSMVPAPAPGPKKVFKGVAKKVINLAGRKAALAPYQHDLTSAVRDLDPLRELLAWDKPLVSGPFVAVNVLGAYAQLHLEPRTFFLMALALSFVYFTEWFKQLCLRLPDVGPRVFRAYAELRRRARARDESGDDEAGVRVARASEPVWKSNIQPEFNFRERFGPDSALLRELDERSIRPKISQNDFDLTELESSEVFAGQGVPLVDFHTGPSTGPR